MSCIITVQQQTRSCSKYRQSNNSTYQSESRRECNSEADWCKGDIVAPRSIHRHPKYLEVATILTERFRSKSMSSCSSEDGKDSSTITSDSESNADDSFSPKKRSCINSTKFNVSCECLDKSTQSVLTSNRLEDILQCSNTGKLIMVCPQRTPSLNFINSHKIHGIYLL